MKNIAPPILLDIMKDGRFLCQLRYCKRGFPKIINGKVYEAYEEKDIKAFVEQQRPSLIGKQYKIEFATQRV